jgi:hypothetical protein
MARAGSPTGALGSGSLPGPRGQAVGGSHATGRHLYGAGPLLRENKYGRRVTSGNAARAAPTLAFGVVGCRLVLVYCRGVRRLSINVSGTRTNRCSQHGRWLLKGVFVRGCTSWYYVVETGIGALLKRFPGDSDR